jgi:acetate kinase
VHGEIRFRAATAVEGDLLSALAEVSSLAPLPNPPAVAAMLHLLSN